MFYYVCRAKEWKIDGFFLINLIKGPDSVGLQLFSLRIRILVLMMACVRWIRKHLTELL